MTQSHGMFEPTMKRTVLVTGASGFVGRSVCAYLCARGYVVRTLSRSRTTSASGSAYQFTDWSDLSAIHAAADGANTIVHLAGRAHVMREGGDVLALYREANVAGVHAIMTVASACGVSRVLFASSVKAVGEFLVGPLTSQTVPAPTDPYGISKLEAERTLHALGKQYAVETCALRFPLVYGPGVKGNVRRLWRLIRKGFPLPFGQVDNRRSMLGVRNLCAYIDSAITYPSLNGETFLLSDGQDLSTEQLVRLMAAALHVKPRLFHMPRWMFAGVAKVGDVASSMGISLPLTSNELHRLLGSLTVDVTATLQHLNMQPPYSPAEEIEYMIRQEMQSDGVSL